MSNLGNTTIFYRDNGKYETPWGNVTEGNGVNEFALGSNSDPLVAGEIKTSGKSLICNRSVPLGCTHTESDIVINFDNHPGWLFGDGSNNTVDRGTVVRHETGHTYGIPHELQPHTLMYTEPVLGEPPLYPGPCDDVYINCKYFGTVSECDKLEPPPTPILLAFERASTRAGHVCIIWETKQQIGVFGFDILRSNDGGEVLGFEKVNSQLIEATGDELIGATYEFIDKTADRKKSYWYVIKANGSEMSESKPFYYLGEASK